MSYNFKPAKEITINSDGSFETAPGLIYLIEASEPVTVSDDSGAIISSRASAGKFFITALSEKTLISSLNCTIFSAVEGGRK